MTAANSRAALLAFVGTQIMPHEPDLRRMLTRLGVKAHERDDVVQEVYCRLLRLDSVEHIDDPRAYVFRTARNVVLGQIRRNRVVSIMTMQNLDELHVADATPNPETATAARVELNQVLSLIRDLPDRCRQVFELRKVHGLSQAETAARLGVSENIVEKETAKGLTAILRTLAGAPLLTKRVPASAPGARHVAD